MAHVVTATELPLVARFLAVQLPASLKLHGETLALLHGIDASHGPGDDLVVSPAGIVALCAADAAGDGLVGVSAAVSRRHHGQEAERPRHLSLSFFATDDAAAADLFALLLVGVEPPPTSMMFAGLDRQFLSAARAAFGGGDLGRRADGVGQPHDTDSEASHWVSPCVLMWRPPPGYSSGGAAAVAPLPEFPAPDGCTLGPLCEGDSYLVNETWAYGKTEAARVQRVLPCIEHQLSVGLRIAKTGELVSWWEKMQSI